jgi:hypothetical protein
MCEWSPTPLRNFLLTLAAAAAAALGVVPKSGYADSDPSIWVGILEDVKGGDFLSPAMNSPHVRVAFHKTEGRWVAADQNLPQTMQWTVNYDGKMLGLISSKRMDDYSAPGDRNIEAITTDSRAVPKVKAGAKSFTFLDIVPNSRPLILTSLPDVHDADNWKKNFLTGSEREVAIKAFRKLVPELERCDDPQKKPYYLVPYSNTDIVFLAAYRSKNGQLIQGMKLDGRKSDCQFFNDEHFFDYWFVLGPKGETRLLGSQMTPMEAIDLDNDGRSEWIFQTSRGSDEDGYELFYDDLAQKTSFSWIYH